MSSRESNGCSSANQAALGVKTSMANGISTTVPQNMALKDQPRSIVAQRPSTSARIRQFSVQSREHLELRCCRIHVLLVVMQSCLGLVVTALGVYMRTLTSTLVLRECPFWAGAPLLLAGLTGIYFCATDFTAYTGSIKAYGIKATCFVLASICVFICMVAAVFAGSHGSRISAFHHCTHNSSMAQCQCSHSTEPLAPIYIYDDIARSCDVIITSVKDYLILQCAFNSIGSGVCLWFVTLLWKSRYQDFHSGLRFYSYSADVPAHPWADPSNPPYTLTQDSPSPLPIRKQGPSRSTHPSPNPRHAITNQPRPS